MPREELIKKTFKHLVRAWDYAPILNLRIETPEEEDRFAHQIFDTLLGEKVSTDIPDRLEFLHTVAALEGVRYART